MRKYLILFFLLFTICVNGQTRNNRAECKFVRITDIPKSKIQKLDSLYISAGNFEKKNCAFPDLPDSILFDYWGKFLRKVGETLKEKGFKWGKETKVFLRGYFNENGDTDFCFYNIIDKDFTKYKEFENALRDFGSSFNFGLKSDKKYAQCGTAIFTDM